METINIILLIIGAIILSWLGYKIGSMSKDHEWIEKLPKIREESIKKSRSVLTGNFSEQLAPYLPDFPFLATECKFLGKPIDMIVFKGLDSGSPDEIVFLEIKSCGAKLSENEKKLKALVNEKKVSWKEYRFIPREDNS